MRPDSAPPPPTRRAAYAQLLFLIGVGVFGVGLFVATPLLRDGCLWGGALLSGGGLLLWPAQSKADQRLRLLLAVALAAVLLRVVTGSQILGGLVIALAVAIVLVAAWMRYGSRR